MNAANPPMGYLDLLTIFFLVPGIRLDITLQSTTQSLQIRLKICCVWD